MRVFNFETFSYTCYYFLFSFIFEKKTEYSLKINEEA